MVKSDLDKAWTLNAPGAQEAEGDSQQLITRQIDSTLELGE